MTVIRHNDVRGSRFIVIINDDKVSSLSLSIQYFPCEFAFASSDESKSLNISTLLGVEVLCVVVSFAKNLILRNHNFPYNSPAVGNVPEVGESVFDWFVKLFGSTVRHVYLQDAVSDCNYGKH